MNKETERFAEPETSLEVAGNPESSPEEVFHEIQEIQARAGGDSQEEILSGVQKRLSLDRENIDVVAEKVAFPARREALQEKRERARETLAKRVKQILAPLTAALALQSAAFAAEDLRPQPARAEASNSVQEKEQKLREMLDVSSSLARKSEKLESRPLFLEELGTISALRETVMTKTNEVAAFSYVDEQEGYQAQFQDSGPKGGVTVFENIEGKKELKGYHTHPLEIVHDERNGEKYPLIMPPSGTDMSECFKIAGKKTIETRIVVDPRGVWEYRCDADSPFITVQRKLEESQAWYEKVMKEYGVSEDDLSATFAALKDVHPLQMGKVFSKILETKYPGIGEALEEAIVDTLSEEDQAYAQFMYDFDFEGTKLMESAKYLTDEELGVNIQEYIQKAEKNGVYISFTPFTAQKGEEE